MTISLPSLPYSMDSLKPHISSETLEFHYGKHHQAYVNNLNNLIKGTAQEGKSLEEIVMKSDGPIFNNAAQIWNHTFYWNSLSPKGGGEPKGKIATAIQNSFGGFEQFKNEFTTKSTGLFGSGWVFLAQDNSGKLILTQESNAQTPLTKGLKPILTWDVWEHAYYIDYRNARPKYVEAFFQLVNWDFANQNLG